MGVIQNAVNQMIGTTAIAARLAPDYETKQELGQLSKQSKQIEAAKSELPKHIQEGTAAEEELNEFERQKLNILQRQQELNPTRQGIRDLIMQRSLVNKTPLMKFGADDYEIRQEQAMMDVAAKQAAKQAQKERFEAFLANIKGILDKPKKKGTTDDGGDK